MTAVDLYTRFLALPVSSGGNDYAAISLSEQRADFLTKGEKGVPIFLLHDSSSAKYYPGFGFRNLIVQFHVTCNVSADGVEKTGQFALVSCDTDALDLHELFVRCVSAGIGDLPEECDTTVLETRISRFRELFRLLAQPTGREVIGLWAELFVILNSGNIDRAVSAWRSSASSRFDFADDRLRLEVKATTRPARIHEFALEQLMFPADCLGLVVSVMTQPLGTGVGILELARAIEFALPANSVNRERLWRNLAEALGADFSEKLDKQFDIETASRTLVLVPMKNVPQPAQPDDRRVTSIRFLADLSCIPANHTPIERRLLVAFLPEGGRDAG